MKLAHRPRSLAASLAALPSISLIPFALFAFLLSPSAFPQGSIVPTTAPNVPIMKTLDQIEPRTPISSLPFTISTPGSYYVTGNLTGPIGSQGITINADNVTLDLGGFELVGPASGASSAVTVTNSHVGARIRNGTARGWGSTGVVASSGSTEMHVEDLRVFGSGGSGIGLGNNGTAERCEVRGSNGAGIAGGTSCKVIACTAVGQIGATGGGINVSSDSIVTDCVATGNGSDGIHTSSRCVLNNCVAVSNTGNGFNASAGSGCIVSNCTAAFNGGTGFTFSDGTTLHNCDASNNTGAGIIAGVGSTIINCTVNLNSGSFGISIGSAGTIIGCSLRANTSNAATSGAINAGTESFISQCAISNTDSTAGSLTASTGMGITAGGASTIERCTVQGSRGDGILVTSSCLVTANVSDRSGFGAGDGAGVHTTGAENRIEANSVTGNDRGIDVDGAGSLIIKNTAATNTTDYDIAVNNRYGPIINITATGTAAVTFNSGSVNVATTLVSTDPWANFSY